MYERIARWAGPDRQRELEAKVQLVAFDSETDCPLPTEIGRGDDDEFVLVDYELDDDDECLTGESKQEPGPLDQLIVGPLTQDWRPVGSLKISGLNEVEVVELLGCDSYRDPLMRVVPEVNVPEWDGAPFLVNGLWVGRHDGDLVLIRPES